MRWLLAGILLAAWPLDGSWCFWDEHTTTEEPALYDEDPRTSFFRWPHAHFEKFWFFFPTKWANDKMNKLRHEMVTFAGISIDFIALGMGTIMNRRTLITSATPFDPYLHRQGDLRVWAIGRAGLCTTPYRYRVWMLRRVLPRSMNPEHQVGPRGTFTMRHDVAVVLTRDQIYLYIGGNKERYMYPTKTLFTRKDHTFHGKQIWESSTGFRNMEHVKSNYRFQFVLLDYNDIVNCENYLPKWWGKHVCFRQNKLHAFRVGVQNGAALVVGGLLTAVGAFDIRYNEERINVYTDLRYYHDWILIMANISAGDYYDYAYQEWGLWLGWNIYNGHGQSKFIPGTAIMNDLYPFGK